MSDEIKPAPPLKQEIHPIVQAMLDRTLANYRQECAEITAAMDTINSLEAFGLEAQRTLREQQAK